MKKELFISKEEAAAFLKRHDRYLILTHTSPDGDTLGSGFGLAMVLEQLGKACRVICADPIPEKYSYFTSLTTQIGEDEPFDAIVAVDVADAKLLGSLQEPFADRIDLCIDHHISNTGYAKATYLDSDAAANCECIFELAKELSVSINRAMALALYTGISTDTGCFRFSNTTARSHQISAALMETGIDTGEINRVMFETKSRTRVKLEGMALEQMEFYFHNRCAVITLTRDMYETTGCQDADLDGVTALSRTIEGVLVGITLREKEEGGFKISVRTYPPIDASAICRRLGGGGHIRAGGCQLSADYTVAEAKAAVLEQVKAVLEEESAGTDIDR